MAIVAVAASGGGIPQSWVTGLGETSTTQKEALMGAIRVEGRNKYKYIQYNATVVAAVAGNVCYYDETAGYENSLVSSDITASDEIGAGVLQAAIADQGFGWIQIKGEAGIETDLSGGAAGDPLTPTGAADGTLDVNIATAANTHICAWAIDVSAGVQKILCDFPY